MNVDECMCTKDVDGVPGKNEPSVEGAQGCGVVFVFGTFQDRSDAVWSVQKVLSVVFIH